MQDNNQKQSPMLSYNVFRLSFFFSGAQGLPGRLHLGNENQFSFRSTYATTAQVNIGRASNENRQKASVRHERYQYIKLTYPNPEREPWHACRT